jgi:DNA-binding transcriptional MerR regulator
MTELSAHTLRYYEKIGLLSGVQRDPSGYRRYSEADVAWIQFLIRLRATGMGISEMKHFSELRSQGEGTVTARRELLEAHRMNVAAHIRELELNLKLIGDKIEHYRRMEGPQPTAEHPMK